ncbi:MAG: indole-3-glycerol phosphate synthase TrpC [Candidatus Acidiferrales bacterium]
MHGENNSGNILLRIYEKRREAVAHRQRVLPLVALKIAAEKKAPPARDFAAAISATGINIIAELKKASPSRGVIRQNYEPAKLAAELAASGVAALSVLTEEDFFSGSLAHLKEARGVVSVPILRKDFIFDPWQVWEARAAGADSFLLIAAVLDAASLSELLALGRQLKMEPLVEVHTREELTRAVDAGARIIGVNCRDLTNFDVRLETPLNLAAAIPSRCIAVAESGIHSREDLEKLSRAGYRAFLIGEYLMTQASPGEGLRQLLSAAASKLTGS